MTNLETYLGKEKQFASARAVSKGLSSDKAETRVNATNYLIDLAQRAGTPILPENANSYVLDRFATALTECNDEDARNYLARKAESVVDGLSQDALKERVIAFMPIDVTVEDAIFYEISGKHREAKMWQEISARVQQGLPVKEKAQIMETAFGEMKKSARSYLDQRKDFASEDSRERLAETMVWASKVTGASSFEGIVANNAARTTNAFYETAGENVVPYAQRCILYKALSGDKKMVDFARTEVMLSTE